MATAKVPEATLMHILAFAKYRNMRCWKTLISMIDEPE